jgi:hypothetical protein
MKVFFAFYNSGMDLESQAQAYADEALVHAASIKKQVTTQIVDVLTGSPAKKYWDSPDTIECVTVDADTKKESMLNPSSLADIDAMIDRL